MTANKDLKIGGLLLAAGGSSRLGRPKQLVEFRGKTLIKIAAESLADSACSPVVVVLGAEIEKSRAEIAHLNIQIAVNVEWQTGMSSSIRAGLSQLIETSPDIDAVVITLCDMPNVTAADIDSLIDAFHPNGTSIIAASHGEVAGVPALFSSQLFPNLLTLSGDKGARNIIREHPENVTRIRLRSAAFDIDTPGDLKYIDG